MKIAIIQFPGSNCERETILAVERAGMKAEEFLWNRPLDELSQFAGYIIVGGFSFEDRSRSGVIASLEPLIQQLKKEDLQGKPILGICNGAQILVESGFVPGWDDYSIGLALAPNQPLIEGVRSQIGFYNAWIHLSLHPSCGNLQRNFHTQKNAFITHLKADKSMKIPTAHAEGRFVIAEPLLEQMKEKGAILLQYVNADGCVLPEFPINPNGSVENIAAVGNFRGNVMAIMPHPERCSAGDEIFTSMKEFILARQNQTSVVSRESYLSTNLGNKFQMSKLFTYPISVNCDYFTIDLKITDNEALSVENALNQRGLPVKVQRQTHWKIDFQSKITVQERKILLQAITQSGELYNSNKEESVIESNQDYAFIVRYKDENVGQLKKNYLERYIQSNFLDICTDLIQNVEKSIRWNLSIDTSKELATSKIQIIQSVLDTNIIANPVSQEVFLYNNPLSKASPENWLNKCIVETDLPWGLKKTGKVRDIYTLEKKLEIIENIDSSDQLLAIVTTDRLSAFDRVLTSIPFKGQVLNLTSAFWFNHTKHIIPNHMIAVPHPSVMIAKRCTPFPVEFVVRGFITGLTSTSLWTNYQNGSRHYCGHRLPDGLQKNQRLNKPIVTPTTKDESHDQLISGEEIIERQLMTRNDWELAERKALELFNFGQQMAEKNGLILVDTKYEMGKDAQGNIMLIDEVHTPDSSRYWIADSYLDRFTRNEEPENIDKEFIRRWYNDNCRPYEDKILPEAPDHLRIELAKRYITLYEKITGQCFDYQQNDLNDLGQGLNLNRSK